MPGLALTLMFSAVADANEVAKTFLFVRHAEKAVALRENGESGRALLPECKPYVKSNGEIDECCLEILNELGEKRAELLANWIVEEQGIQLTHAFSTHKTRTWQTVLPTAIAAGLDENASDVDLKPGDGVQQIPPFAEECDPGFESPRGSLGLVVAAILDIPDGSAAIVSGHSSTLYPMMELLGLNTDDDPVAYPKRPDGRVDGYNNLWIVTVDEDGNGTLHTHVLLDLALVSTVTTP